MSIWISSLFTLILYSDSVNSTPAPRIVQDPFSANTAQFSGAGSSSSSSSTSANKEPSSPRSPPKTSHTSWIPSQPLLIHNIVTPTAVGLSEPVRKEKRSITIS